MPRIYEPTLVKSCDRTSANGGGANFEVEFDFALNEGAKIEKVVFLPDGCVGAAGELDFGLNLRPQDGSPAALGDMQEDDDVFAMGVFKEQFSTSGGSNLQAGGGQYTYDFHEDSIYIVKDLTLQLFEASGNARACGCKIYYKRCRFSDAEMGNLLRNY